MHKIWTEIDNTNQIVQSKTRHTTTCFSHYWAELSTG